MACRPSPRTQSQTTAAGENVTAGRRYNTITPAHLGGPQLARWSQLDWNIYKLVKVSAVVEQLCKEAQDVKLAAITEGAWRCGRFSAHSPQIDAPTMPFSSTLMPKCSIFLPGGTCTVTRPETFSFPVNTGNINGGPSNISTFRSLRPSTP
jgi:hypothetical protein